MSRKFERYLIHSALAAPRSHHHVGNLFLVVCCNHNARQWSDYGVLCTEILSAFNIFRLHLFVYINILVVLTFFLLAASKQSRQQGYGK